MGQVVKDCFDSHRSFKLSNIKFEINLNGLKFSIIKDNEVMFNV